MGWASYNEDIMSRWIGSRKSQRVPAVRQAAVPNGTTRKKNSSTMPQVKPTTKQQRQEPRQSKTTMAKLKDFVVSDPRPLPVIVLADVSGSMVENGKIDALNEAISNMLRVFAEEDSGRAEIHTSVVTFGMGGAKVTLPLSPAAGVKWTPLKAAGKTPLGEALMLATSMIEDRELMPSRAYRPTLVLVSDGQPTDDWESPLQRLLESPRGSKATRFAMAIGDDADHKVLSAFLHNPEGKVFQASDSNRINQFFCFVTMSVAGRSRSTNPNAEVLLSPEELDEFEF